MQILPNTYGLNAVATIWIFKLTYRRFPLYMLIEVIANSIYAYLYLEYFLRIRNILEFNLISPIFIVIIHTIAGVCLYYFQVWIEGIYAKPYRNDNK